MSAASKCIYSCMCLLGLRHTVPATMCVCRFSAHALSSRTWACDSVPRFMTESSGRTSGEQNWAHLVNIIETLLREWQRRHDEGIAVRERRLEEREVLLMERERRLQRLEQAVETRLASMGTGATSVPAMAPRRLCDYCHRAECTRGGPCGRHRHHNCDECHERWRAGLPKGAGRG